MITGVSRGLGKVLALEMARRGHTVVGCARSQEKVQSLQAEVAAVNPAGVAAPRHFFTTVDVVRKGFFPSCSPRPTRVISSVWSIDCRPTFCGGAVWASAVELGLSRAGSGEASRGDEPGAGHCRYAVLIPFSSLELLG